MLATSVLFANLVEHLATRSDSTINPYGYTPTFGVCILFIVLFATSAVVHFVQAIRKRTRYMIWSATIGGTLEALGWFGRAWSSKNVHDKTPFIIQILSTFLAPTFVAAANFVILGGIITALGPAHSRLAPKRYAQIFVTIDVLALLIQALGAAIASRAVLNNKSSATGSHIMLFGIIVGLIEIAIYITLAGGFFWNYAHDKVVRPGALDYPSTTALMEQGQRRRQNDSNPSRAVKEEGGRNIMTPSIRAMSYALVFSTLFLLIRAVYRAIALAAGFQSSINHSQILFDLLDGLMIILAIGTLNVFHPGYRLPAD